MFLLHRHPVCSASPFLLGDGRLLSLPNQYWISQKIGWKDGRRQEKALGSEDPGSHDTGCKSLPASLGCWVIFLMLLLLKWPEREWAGVLDARGLWSCTAEAGRSFTLKSQCERDLNPLQTERDRQTRTLPMCHRSSTIRMLLNVPLPQCEYFTVWFLGDYYSIFNPSLTRCSLCLSCGCQPQTAVF